MSFNQYCYRINVHMNFNFQCMPGELREEERNWTMKKRGNREDDEKREKKKVVGDTIEEILEVKKRKQN